MKAALEKDETHPRLAPLPYVVKGMDVSYGGMVWLRTCAHRDQLRCLQVKRIEELWQRQEYSAEELCYALQVRSVMCVKLKRNVFRRLHLQC